MNNYYPFELHCHTNHSDGDMSPCELAQNAKRKGYKGIAVTDHNTISAVEEVVYWGQRYGVEVLEGIEWTTFWGHLTAIGGKNDIDWRSITRENIDEIIKEAYNNGTLLTIAHPKRNGTPLCTGCYMDLPITKYEYINAFEVWTQPSPHLAYYNNKAIEYYDELLQKGYKLAAVYGYDWHREDKKQQPHAMTFIGSKNNNTYKTLKEGDTFVSLGLVVDAHINSKKIPFSSKLKSGEYIFDVAARQFNADFCKKYGIAPKMYKLTGSSLDSDVIADINNPIKVNLKSGYVRIEILGEIEDQKECILLLTSPYYIT